MNRDEVKAAILKVAGNPEAGIIAELADAFADAFALELGEGCQHREEESGDRGVGDGL